MKLFLTKSVYRSLEKLHETDKEFAKILEEAIDNIKDSPYDFKKWKENLKLLTELK